MNFVTNGVKFELSKWYRLTHQLIRHDFLRESIFGRVGVASEPQPQAMLQFQSLCICPRGPGTQ